ncbi:MAG: FprA family A-type flavoprotein [Synergistaceae bacterium]|jgi:flavorubredoxin|nr:FprA family A-type flavoprotein [Synergistaceae bacterium]
MYRNGIISVSDSVFWVGAQDRTTDKFEGMWSIPHGVAYNSYLLTGEKNILIDTVKEHFIGGFLDRIAEALAGRSLDYVVVNHMEPDHSGSMRVLRDVYPNAKLIGNAKTAEMMKNFFGISEGIVTVSDGEAVELGGRKFVFVFTPMVHWPESMVAYDATDRILFSSDILGGFGATDGGIFDDEADMNMAVGEMARYYVNIVGRFAAPALKALAKVRTLDIGIICPAHGHVWRTEPGRVIDIYEKLSRQETDEGVVVVYGTMYGNTAAAAERIASDLVKNRVPSVHMHDIARSDISQVTTDIWRHSGLILASCTYNMELFPPMARLLRHLENKNMKGRYAGLCGTFSWAEASLRELSAFVERSKGGWTHVEPKILIKSGLKASDCALCETLSSNMARAIKG